MPTNSEITNNLVLDTPGKRVTDLIQTSGLDRKKVMKYLGITKDTLSRIENDKQKNISDELISKMARLFSVSSDYILCKSAFKDVSVYDYDSEENAINESRQNYQIDSMVTLLKSLGASVTLMAQFGEVSYKYNENSEGLIPISGFEKMELIDQMKLIEVDEIPEEIAKYQGNCKLYYKVGYKNRTFIKEYQEFRKWAKSLICQMELALNIETDIVTPIDHTLIEDEISLALNGKIENVNNHDNTKSSTEIDKSWDLYVYSEEIGLTRYVIAKDATVNFYGWDSFGEELQSDILELLYKDNKGFSYNHDTVRYDKDKHIVGKVMSTKEERYKIRCRIAKALGVESDRL